MPFMLFQCKVARKCPFSQLVKPDHTEIEQADPEKSCLIEVPLDKPPQITGVDSWKANNGAW